MLTSVNANMHKLDDTIGRLDTREKKCPTLPIPPFGTDISTNSYTGWTPLQIRCKLYVVNAALKSTTPNAK